VSAGAITRRALAGFGLAVGVLCLSLPCFADEREEIEHCIDAHGSGQDQERERELLAAKASFVACGDPACPASIQAECAQMLERVNQALPTVVLASVNANGDDLPSARAFVDGTLVQEKLNGGSIALDPGPHEIKIQWESGAEATRSVIIRQGEKNRSIVFEAPPREIEAVEVRVDQTKRTIAYVLAGVGVVALGSFAYFGLSGSAKQGELDECKPHCEQSAADAMRSDYLIADVSLALGVTSLAVGGYLYFTAGPIAAPADDQQAADPLPRAWGGMVRGRF
jgi:hypothetical protein